jgi:hypothetical protein
MYGLSDLLYLCQVSQSCTQIDSQGLSVYIPCCQQGAQSIVLWGIPQRECTPAWSSNLTVAEFAMAALHFRMAKPAVAIDAD